MNALIQQILSIVVLPPGNLIYHLVLAFSIAAGLQFSLIHASPNDSSAQRRLVIGFSVLLGCQFVLFILSGLAWQGLLSADVLLPPLDRAITALSLVWILWLWVFPEPNRASDTLAITFSVLLFIGFGFTYSVWQATPTQQNFNSTLLAMLWEGICLALGLCGLILLLIRRPLFLGASLGFFILTLIGHALQMLFPALVNTYPGIVRFTQIISYPLLLLLPQRWAGQSEPAQRLFQSRKGSDERRRYASSPKAATALLQVAAETNPQQLGEAITRSVSQVMLADICLLITFPEGQHEAHIEGGYNLVQNSVYNESQLTSEELPVLLATLSRNHSLNLKGSARSTDQKSLAERFGFKSCGGLLAVPMAEAPGKAFGALALLSPYSNRVWNKEDQTYLTLLTEAIAPIWQRMHPSVLTAVIEEPPANPESASLQTEWLKEDELETTRLEQAEAAAPGSAELSPMPPPLNIERIIDYVLSQLSHQIGEKNLSLRVDIPENLPDLIVDQGTLQQVLYNLLENACEVTPAEKAIQIKLRPHSDGMAQPGILIQVTDQGGGLSPEDQKRFFALVGDEESHTLPGVSKPEEIFAAKVLIEGQGGSLWLESDAAQTTTVDVLVIGKTLPPAENVTPVESQRA